MKAVILAGGLGTRLSEETETKPKPMVEIGGYPILWHIMKIYAAHGITDFIVCCGYKGHMIKRFFADYALTRASVTFDFRTGETEIHDKDVEPWRVTLADTGANTMTGGRIKRIAKYIRDETFCCTYGDGVSNVDISALIAYHRAQKTYVTMTAVQPPGRFGAFTLSKSQTRVTSFREKPHGDSAWVNGGFFVMNPAVFDYIEGDATSWEHEPMRRLAEDGQLAAYLHDGFWHAMDTLRDRITLDDQWRSGTAEWKIW